MNSRMKLLKCIFSSISFIIITFNSIPIITCNTTEQPSRPSLTIKDSLKIRPLNNGKFIHASFNFQSSARTSPNVNGFLPRAINTIIYQDDVEYFKLSLARGVWRYDVDLDNLGEHEIFPAGAYLQARSSSKDNRFEEETWKKFTHSLAGISCASINQIDMTTTGKLPDGSYFGQLPAEAVCTENLTPWMKLLHTSRNSESSLSYLIDPYRLAEGYYFGIDLEVFREKCDSNNNDCQITISQSISVVFEESPRKKSLEQLLTNPSKKLRNLQILNFDEPISYQEFGSDTIQDGLKSLDVTDNFRRDVEVEVAKTKNNVPEFQIKRYLESNGRGQMGGLVKTSIKRNCLESKNLQRKHPGINENI